MIGEISKPHSSITSTEHTREAASAQEILKLLPRIPDGWLRLTHFTDKASAGAILGGEFVHDPGFLSSKTDAYSSVKQIEEVLKTGNIGSFNRSYFGDCVVLIDLEANEYKRRQTVRSTTSTIPNKNVVGYIKIIGEVGSKSYTFFTNINYQPAVSAIEFSQRAILPDSASDASYTVLMVSDQTGNDNDEVW